MKELRDRRADSTSRWSQRQFLAALLALVAVSILLRVLYGEQIGDYVLYQVPLVDAEEYVDWAKSIASGKAYSPDVFYKAPLYPFYLGAFMSLLGAQLSTVFIANAALGLLQLCLIVVWLRRLLGTPWALLGGAVAIVYGPLLYFEAQPLPTLLGLTCGLLSLIFLSRSVEVDWRHTGLAGICIGLASLSRPSFLLWGLAVLIHLILVSNRRGLRNGAFFCLCLGLVILPVTIRNYRVGKEFVLISANGGINLFLGNNERAQHTEAMRPGLEWEVLVTSMPAFERQGQARWDRYFGRQAIRWIAGHPVAFVEGLFRKSVQYFHAQELSRNLDVRGFRQQSRLLRWMPRYACLAPVLGIGLWIAIRRRRQYGWVVLFATAVYLSNILIFVSERYRLDAFPATLFFFLLGCRELWCWLRRRDRLLHKREVLVTFTLGCAVAFHPFVDTVNLNAAQAASQEGMAYFRQGRFSLAGRSFDRAVAAVPNNADAHFQWAATLRKQGRLHAAAQHFEKAAQLVPENIKPVLAEAITWSQLGEFDKALPLYEKSTYMAPEDPSVFLDYANALRHVGLLAQSREIYRSILSQVPKGSVRQQALQGLKLLGDLQPKE